MKIWAYIKLLWWRRAYKRAHAEAVERQKRVKRLEHHIYGDAP